MQPTNENTQNQKSGTRKGLNLFLITCGCAVVILCMLLACAASAGFWLIKRGAIVSNPDNSAGIEQTELESLRDGNAEDGEQVFNGDGNCSACHATSSEMRLVGPSLLGIGSRAASNKPGLAAETYLWESIVRPDAYVVDGYPASVMPAGFGQWLSDQQIADLIAYLLTK